MEFELMPRGRLIENNATSITPRDASKFISEPSHPPDVITKWRKLHSDFFFS